MRLGFRLSPGGMTRSEIEAILGATDMLEQALPRGAELMNADIPAYRDDVVAGLRRLAREME